MNRWDFQEFKSYEKKMLHLELVIQKDRKNIIWKKHLKKTHDLVWNVHSKLKTNNTFLHIRHFDHCGESLLPTQNRWMTHWVAWAVNNSTNRWFEDENRSNKMKQIEIDAKSWNKNTRLIVSGRSCCAHALRSTLQAVKEHRLRANESESSIPREVQVEPRYL